MVVVMGTAVCGVYGMHWIGWLGDGFSEVGWDGVGWDRAQYESW